MSVFPRIFAIFRATAENGIAGPWGKLNPKMSTDSPPGPSRPRAGGDFTWPPTSEELDAIEVIALDGSRPATTYRASDTPATAAAPALLATSKATAAPAVPANAPASAAPPPLPALSVLPATLVVPAAPAAPVKAKAGAPSLRAATCCTMPRREDFAYVGVTVASALAIAVAATLQLSDSWSASHTHELRTAAAPAATAPPALAASPVANVALLQLVEKGPDEVARTALNATTPPVTVMPNDAPPAAAAAATAPSVTEPAVTASASIAPAKTNSADVRARRAARVAAQSGGAFARRATYARRSTPNLVARERRDRNGDGGRDRAGDRVADRRRDRGSIATAALAASVASPPLRLPESYVQPRVVSQGSGRHRGQVVLAVQVRPNGRVGGIEVLSKDDDRGYDDLERAAVSAVKRWRYRPALRDGVPAPARVKVVVNFS